MDDFWMELDSEVGLLRVFDRGVFGIVRGGHWRKSFGQTGQLVAVGVPDLEGLGEFAEEWAFLAGDRQRAFSVFAFGAFFHLAAQKMTHQLHAVANAQHGHAQIEDGRIGQGSLGRVHRGGAARQDDAFGSEFLDLRGRGVVAHQGRVNVQFTNPACNDLGVLRPEIEDDDLLHEQRWRVEHGTFKPDLEISERKSLD